MHTNVSAEVSATLNRDDIITLLEEGEVSADGVRLHFPEGEGHRLLEEL